MFPLYLLIIVFPKFDPLTTTGMALYCKMSQNVTIYLAYTEYERNQVQLILRLNGIDLGKSNSAYTENKRDLIPLSLSIS
jgi:hypothetical protein